MPHLYAAAAAADAGFEMHAVYTLIPSLIVMRDQITAELAYSDQWRSQIKFCLGAWD